MQGTQRTRARSFQHPECIRHLLQAITLEEVSGDVKASRRHWTLTLNHNRQAFCMQLLQSFLQAAAFAEASSMLVLFPGLSHQTLQLHGKSGRIFHSPYSYAKLQHPECIPHPTPCRQSY